MNLFCPFCGFTMAGYKLPLVEGTTCPHCRAEVTTQDISPNFGMFDPKAYLVTGLGPDGKELTVRVTAVSEWLAEREAERAGVRYPTNVRLESPPRTRSWWGRVTVREHLLYAVLLAVAPGGGWVASGWMAADSPLGGVGAAVANYLLLLVCYHIGRQYRKPVKLSERPTGNGGSDGRDLVEFVVRTAVVVAAAYSMTVIGIFGGSLLGAVVMYPLALIAKDKWLHDANTLACVAFYFLAGVGLTSHFKGG